MLEKDMTLLFKHLQGRSTPEEVAKVILDSGLELTAAQRAILGRAGRSVRSWWMSADFRRPETKIDRQVDLIPILFGVTAPFPPAQTLHDLRKQYGMNPDGETSRRLEKAERRSLGIYKSARWYNKRRRLLDTIARKRHRLADAEELYLFTRISKAALSVEIPYDLFARDLPTAAFVTYLAARMNRRSTFTNQSQDRAFDKISEMLLSLCEHSETAQWFAIAHLLPDASILARLTDGERGYLIGRWFTLLQAMGERLRKAWPPGTDRLRMIVQRGDDSSTWNAVAGAWNRAREHWVSLTYAVSGEEVLNAVCPGKVMRLMAGDVVRWHESSGGDVHPDTAVWAMLPLPWHVLSGRARCGLTEIRAACEAAGASFPSWSFRSGREAVEFKPTPNLVHGVEVASPDLARLLQRAGVFSGKRLKAPLPDFGVVRDEHGSALLATDPEDMSSASSIRAGGSLIRQDRV